jgi:hypothetical protein
MKKSGVAIWMLCLSLSGCVSAMKRDLQRVDIVTDPPGATVSALGQTLISPGTLEISSERDAVEIRFEKEGYVPRTVTLVRRRDGRFWSRLAFIPVDVSLGTVFAPTLSGSSAAPGYARGGSALAAMGYIRNPEELVPSPFASDEIVIRLEPAPPISTAEIP